MVIKTTKYWTKSFFYYYYWYENNIINFKIDIYFVIAKCFVLLSRLNDYKLTALLFLLYLLTIKGPFKKETFPNCFAQN